MELRSALLFADFDFFILMRRLGAPQIAHEAPILDVWEGARTAFSL